MNTDFLALNIESRKQFLIRGLIAVASLALCLCCKSANIDATNQSDHLSPKLSLIEAWADFDVLRQSLEEVHPGLYRYSTKIEIDRLFDGQRAKLNSAVGKLEFLAIVDETLAGLRCGHTRCRTDEKTRSIVSSARKFPFQVLIEGGRLTVLLNNTKDDDKIRPGMEILEINGRRGTNLIHDLCRFLSADGDIQTGKIAGIGADFAELYWTLIDQTNEFLVSAKDSFDRTVTTKLTGVSDSERGQNQNPVNNAMKTGIGKIVWSRENLAFRFLKEPEIAEIRIRGFGGSNFPKWMAETFETLRRKGTKTLVIDLRGNGGGNDSYGAMLLSYLTDKPFRYFDHINLKTISPNFNGHSDWKGDHERELREGTTPNPEGGFLATAKLHPGLAEQAPAKNPFLGKVFVLTDGNTFSTAADFCAVVSNLKIATFIGEETGGAYYGNNSGLMPTVTLPNSGFQFRLPMYEYWNAVEGTRNSRRGTLPDYAVETKTEALLKGVDEQVSLAMKLAADEKAGGK